MATSLLQLSTMTIPRPTAEAERDRSSPLRAELSVSRPVEAVLSELPPPPELLPLAVPPSSPMMPASNRTMLARTSA